MNHHNCLKYLTAIAIAFGTHSTTIAQTKPNTETAPFSFKNNLSHEWEDATLTHTLNSSTEIKILKFSPDGQLLAGVGASYITLWQVDDGEIERILPGHYATELNLEIAPTAIAFSPNSRWLATATWSQGLLSPDSSIMVWDSSTGENVLTIPEADGCRQVLFDVEGKILYGACGFGVTAWSFPEGEKLFNFDSEYAVEAIALSADGQIMATVDANVSGGQQGEASNKIQLWQLEDEKPSLIKTLDGHDNDIAQLEFTGDGRKLVSSSYDGKINVWNWQTGTIEQKTKNLYSKNGLFSLNANDHLIAGNFRSSPMTSLVTGLPLRNKMMIPRLEETSAIAFNPQTEIFAWTGKADNFNPPVVHLWQTADSTPELSPTKESKYRSLPIEQYWGDREQSGGETTELNTSNPSPIGQDPSAIAIAALGLTEVVESEQEEVELDYPQDNVATVTITQSNLADDSVAGMRYLVKFAPYGDRADEQWRVVWAGQQFKCQANRGHQDWGTDLCQ